MFIVYTDKFGQKLKEDGIYAGKTAFANDKYKKDNTQAENKTFSKENLTYEDYLKIAKYLGYDEEDLDVVKVNITDDGMVEVPQKSAGLFGSMEPVYENVENIINGVKNTTNEVKAKVKSFFDEYIPYYSFANDDVKLSDNGKLSNDDKERNNEKKKMIKCLSANWYGASDNKEMQEDIHDIAEAFREYDDSSFNRAVLLNASDGAGGLGHNAIMLLNKENEGLIFSFYSTNSKLPKAILTNAEVRFGVLSADEVNKFLNKRTKISLKLVASDNSVTEETYDRFVCYDLPTSGYKMYQSAIDLYDSPGFYSFVIRQCDDIAVELLKEGGINPLQIILPNWTYYVSDIFN